MLKVKEIKRIIDVDNDRTDSINTDCRGCGKIITLKFNGGELDSSTCCGFIYTLEFPRIDLVIYEKIEEIKETVDIEDSENIIEPFQDPINLTNLSLNYD